MAVATLAIAITSDSFCLGAAFGSFAPMDDWERNFAEQSVRRRQRRRKKKLQRQVKAIVLVGIAVAVIVWFATGAADRTFSRAGEAFASHSRR